MRVPDGSRLVVKGGGAWLSRIATAIEDAGATAVRPDDQIETSDLEAADLVLLDAAGDIDLDPVVSEIRSVDAEIPILAGYTDASEADHGSLLASSSVEVLPAVDTQDESAILDRLGDRIHRYRERERLRDRSRLLEREFQEREDGVWILDEDRRIVRQNDAARALTGDSPPDTVPFEELPVWEEASVAPEELREVVADSKSAATAPLRFELRAEDRTVHYELTARPMRRPDGDRDLVVVAAEDVTESVELAAELEKSQEIHRTVLRNMTETIFITDEDGEFTYVCPNVHFIFGYTAEEVHEMRTADELLYEDLFDRDELAESGVLTNVEVSATDKAGAEKTLLMNVREVDIHGGTILYSFRDISMRKRREEALASLQVASRDLLYAETEQEIAQIVVERSTDILDVDVGVLYRYDETANELQPLAYSPRTENLHGPLSTLAAGAESLPTQAFLDGTSLFLDDVHDSDRLQNQATEIRSGAYIPLSEHGVFFAGATEKGVFTEVTRELADLVSATAEAAFDRVKRETELREVDRKLQQRNADLERLDELNEIIREIDQAVIQADSRSEIGESVCSRLTDTDRFAFAWIGRVDPASGELTPEAWSGDGKGYVDAVSLEDGKDGAEISVQAARRNEVVTIPTLSAGMGEEPWRKQAISWDFQSAISVPLTYDEVSYGVLTVYATQPDAFSERAIEIFSELRQTIASAISAAERKTALLASSNTKLEYAVESATNPIITLAAEADCTLSVQGNVQQSDDGAYIFASVLEGNTGDIVDVAEGSMSFQDTRVISAGTDEGMVRLRLAEPFIAQDLASHGGVLREMQTDGETTRLTIMVPDTVDQSQITNLVAGQFDSVELISKVTIDEPAANDLYTRFLGELTDRQLEVVQAAYYGGYFESPRESNGEEIAEVLNISPPAFYRHTRTVQRKLFSTLFDEMGVPADVATRG